MTKTVELQITYLLTLNILLPTLLHICSYYLHMYFCLATQCFLCSAKKCTTVTKNFKNIFPNFPIFRAVF